MHQPSVPDEPVAIVTEQELTALLKVTSGKDLDSRREHAMIRLFLDCGLRVGEMSGQRLEDVDLDVYAVVHVIGKGSRPWAVPFGGKTGQALDRYLRVRAKHPLDQDRQAVDRQPWRRHDRTAGSPRCLEGAAPELELIISTHTS